jgi:hypothetical protein
LDRSRAIGARSVLHEAQIGTRRFCGWGECEGEGLGDVGWFDRRYQDPGEGLELKKVVGAEPWLSNAERAWNYPLGVSFFGMFLICDWVTHNQVPNADFFLVSLNLLPPH